MCELMNSVIPPLRVQARALNGSQCATPRKACKACNILQGVLAGADDGSMSDNSQSKHALPCKQSAINSLLSILARVTDAYLFSGLRPGIQSGRPGHFGPGGSQPTCDTTDV